MKGNHNNLRKNNLKLKVVINMSKIQNERKSQHRVKACASEGSCN